MMPTPTDHEIEFLRGLGTWSEAGKRTSRRDLLARYLAAVKLRTNWDAIDREEILKKAKELI